MIWWDNPSDEFMDEMSGAWKQFLISLIPFGNEHETERSSNLDVSAT